MIDFSRIEEYRENNRIEAKKALGGLPHSIWETYSAFANALGGLILLGVEEYRDKSLHTVDLPEPEKLVREFWEMVNDPKKASVNILSARDVAIYEVNGDHIIVIDVPRADRGSKPVYVDGNPLTGTYRRNGEGDYRCSAEEIRAMFRDADTQSRDMRVLEHTGFEAVNTESLHDYRRRMRLARPGHVWNTLEDGEFLLKINGAGTGEDGELHPTAAGLLMFGTEPDIVREFPQYLLDYREGDGAGGHWTERILSSSGEWSGNGYDFFCRVCERLKESLAERADGEMTQEDGEAPVFQAVRGALANCLVNADYDGRGGLVIENEADGISLSNPGTFRIRIDRARSGGLSDPRNDAMLKMLNLIDMGERAGSGIPMIFRVWREQDWIDPAFTQSFEPERITLRLSFAKKEDGSRVKTDRGKQVSEQQKAAVIEYLTETIRAKTSDIADVLRLSTERTRAVLAVLMEENIVVAEGEGRKRVYRLKW